MSNHVMTTPTNRDQAMRAMPVVMLLGWLESRPKQLVKYEQIYTPEAYTVLHYTPTVQQVFFRPETLGDAAAAILKTLSQPHLSGRPVLLHVFSNAGGLLYRDIVHLLHSGAATVPLIGTIFDSCPFRATPRSAWKAVYHSNPTLPAWQRHRNAAASTARLLALQLRPKAWRLTWWRRRYVADLKANPLLHPELYLYSTADPIVPCAEVEDVIAARQEMGVEVRAQRWEESGHCQHFMVYKSDYVTACRDFMVRCLERMGTDETRFVA